MSTLHSKTMTMEDRLSRVRELVRQFKENEDFYMSKDFVESEVRSKFIDPLLECLKWDVKNEKGARPDKREVITEDRVVVAGQVKHPDYTLTFGGVKKMYIEAKQPSVDLKTNAEPALQVRRYARSAGLPIAILTDFQEFAIYDARVKTSNKDTASTARIEYLTYDQYEEKFEELYNRISWDAVDLGHFDTYYESAKDKRGTASIGEELLEMIERWRVLLAEDIALNNEEMSEEELTTCVQKIIDRVLFLRICEDKEIEPSKQLQKLIEKKRKQGERRDRIGTIDASNSSIADNFNLIKRASNSKDKDTVLLSNVSIYGALKALFANCETRFNAGLFKNDEALNALNVQDKTLIAIIAELYYPACEYEFSVIPVEILGSIYERFLGRIIRFKRKTKNGHSVEIIEKPEVQKAGGVYYTPSYIVDYIVRETIGKKIEGCKNLEEVAQLKVCDPACGSGSFLVGAYQYLLDWHLDYYYKEERRENSEKKGLIYKDASTQEWKLDIEEKRRILLTHIFGVDIDAQAVEVTKLSLFLKLLENEGSALSKHGQASLFKTSELKKILPSMHENIKCGNSLIGSDYYDDAGRDLFTLEEQKRVNAFDWHLQFSNILKSGGFDCVIGNPPYVFSRDSKEKGISTEDKAYYAKHYKLAKYQINLYHLFLEKGVECLKDDGLFSFIIPNNWLTINTNKEIREFVLNKSDVSVLNFKYKVFEKAEVDTCILCFKKSEANKKIVLLQSVEKEKIELIKEMKTSVFLDTPEHVINIEAFVNTKVFNILEKIEKSSIQLGECTQIKAGLQAYEVGKGKPKQTEQMKKERIYHSKEKINDVYFQYVDGSDVKRYQLTWERCEYLLYGENLAAPRKDWRLFSSPRILVRQIPSRPPYCIHACYTEEVLLNDRNSMNIINIQENPYFILAVLNSKPLSFWFQHRLGKLTRGTFPQFKVNELSIFPIPKASEEAKENLAHLAKDMMDTISKLNVAKFDSDKKFLTQRIDLLDQKIDSYVCELYGVSEEEM